MENPFYLKEIFLFDCPTGRKNAIETWNFKYWRNSPRALVNRVYEATDKPCLTQLMLAYLPPTNIPHLTLGIFRRTSKQEFELDFIYDTIHWPGAQIRTVHPNFRTNSFSGAEDGPRSKLYLIWYLLIPALKKDKSEHSTVTQYIQPERSENFQRLI